MNVIQLTLQTPVGEALTAQLEPGRYSAGSAEEAALRLPFEGVAERHVVISVEETRVAVEPLADGVQVNSDPITERVEVAFPAAVEIAGVKLMFELKSADAEVGQPEASLPLTPPSVGTDSQCAPTMVADWTGPRRFPGSGRNLNTPKPRRNTDVMDRPAENEAPLQGAYKLAREIARGGMGKIYSGEDAELEREVAVKVSSLAEGGLDPRFEKEAKVLAKLAHPNIVPIYAKGLDGQGRPYYSMKLVKGRTLQGILDGLKRGDLEFEREYPLSRLLLIFQKVSDAMAFAHAKRVLHRDLKPENIMVGEYGEVLVMDWGLAKNLGESDLQDVAKTRVRDTGDYGVTMEGEVMGTPQYMSPEQAEGRVAELDERSDIYSLGGILYAILTLRAPIDGRTLNEVLTKVKSGEISLMASRTGGNGKVTVEQPAAMGREVPEALQAVTLKAMALKREQRYENVEAFAADIERYQNGFATHAEHAGALRQAVLLVKRNKGLSGAVLAMLVVVSGFSAKVVVEGRKATEALRELRASAPVFSQRAEDALQEGNLAAALEAATSALRLDPDVEDYHRIRGNALLSMMRFDEAAEEYRLAGTTEQAQSNIQLAEALTQQLAKEGLDKTRRRLFQELNAQGRQGEAEAVILKKNPAVIPDLVKRLEAKLLPVPGTKVFMCKTELTVGEWKLYLKAEGLPAWQQPTNDRKDWKQTDEHPVVRVTWNQAMKFCEWLRKATGKEWSLPTNAEWEAAVGKFQYPWGDYYPPNWDDGNYAVLPDGKQDPKTIGVDGIRGTSPVASFKPNAFGFYDLGGNVWEWTSDGFDRIDGGRVWRGGSWDNSATGCKASVRYGAGPTYGYSGNGLRLVRRSGN